MIAFLRSEKNIACFFLFRDLNVVCPIYCRSMNANAAKYILRAGIDGGEYESPHYVLYNLTHQIVDVPAVSATCETDGSTEATTEAAIEPEITIEKATEPEIMTEKATEPETTEITTESGSTSESTTEGNTNSTNEEKKNAPNTGDPEKVSLYIIVMGLSLAGVIMIIGKNPCKITDV